MGVNGAWTVGRLPHPSLLLQTGEETLGYAKCLPRENDELRCRRAVKRQGWVARECPAIALTVNGYVINFAKSDGGGMNRRGFVIAVRLLGLGWYVAIAIILGVVGGLWLDDRIGTLPLFTLLGVLLGSVAAFYGLYRMVEPLFNVNEQTDDQ